MLSSVTQLPCKVNKSEGLEVAGLLFSDYIPAPDVVESRCPAEGGVRNSMPADMGEMFLRRMLLIMFLVVPPGYL